MDGGSLVKKKSFISKYKWWIVLFAILFTAIYIVIYLCFKGDGFLKAGLDLEKRDWLSFLGSYLSFAGSAIISLVAIFQSRYFADVEKSRQETERKKKLQPIFSINIEELDSQVAGTVDPVNLYNHSSRQQPKHSNVMYGIENVGEYPICNVIIFDQYICQMLKPNEKIHFQVAYAESPDLQRWKDKLIQVYESEHGKSSKGIPEKLDIIYDDIDGNAMRQSFALAQFGDSQRLKDYYSLEEIADAIT